MSDNTLVVINETNWLDLPNDVSGIAKDIVRVNWDVREKSPHFSTEWAKTPAIEATLLTASRMYACWSEELGKPYCYGFGQECPSHPGASSKGITLIFDEVELGTVYMVCFGLLYNWAVGVVKRASKNDGVFQTAGAKIVATKHGDFRIPELAK